MLVERNLEQGAAIFLHPLRVRSSFLWPLSKPQLLQNPYRVPVVDRMLTRHLTGLHRRLDWKHLGEQLDCIAVQLHEVSHAGV